MTCVATTRPLIDAANALTAVELLPIPAAIVVRADGTMSISACNHAFRAAGLVGERDRSPLLQSIGAGIAAFLDSSDLTESFAWSVGEAIDRRYFTATFARSSAALRGSCLVTLIDETSRRHTERSFYREMTTDSLTGLPNRQGFGDLIEAAGASRADHAVLVVDLDRFGRFNACLGSLSGDELLISVARRIKSALRARDSLARIGGDEFGIFLALDEDRAEAEHVAKRIRIALAAPFRLSDYEICVECSIGIAFGGDEPDTCGDDAGADGSEELIRHAQFAVNRAKATGKAEAYQAQAFTAVREQFAIETQLRRAIENGDLRLAFQPICELSSGQIVCFEALARWRTPDGRDIPPVDFIAVAEESGLIVPLGRWALDEATRTLASWDAAANGNCGVQVAVNLSPIQLQRDGVVGLVGDALTRTGLTGGRLKLELTESALVADPERTAQTMRALKDLGTTLAMDDFGTGYSNLAHLQTLPIDILKIDRSFVTGMLADRDKIAIVRAVLSLAQALNMRTIAEGIETNALAQTLSALGCNMGQGFLYARPLEPAFAYAMIAPPSV